MIDGFTQNDIDGILISVLSKISYANLPDYIRRVNPEYFGCNAAREVFADITAQVAESGKYSLDMSLSKLSQGARDFVFKYVIGKDEYDFPYWLSVSKDEFLKRELRSAIQEQRGAFGIDATVNIHRRLGELLENVKSETELDLHTEFVIELQSEQTELISSGFKNFDTFVLDSGFEEGQNVIIGGLPGTGKTSLMLCIAYNMAVNGVPVDVVSYELTPKRLHRRLVCMKSGVPGSVIKQRSFSAGQYDKCVAASEYIKSLPLRIIRISGGLNQLSMHIMTSKCKVVFIDYLQRVPMDGKHSRYEQVTQLSNRLNECAKSTDKILIMASSLNRSAGEKPKLSDFRNSGDIEYDADIACILSEQEANPGVIDVHVPKNRDGESAIVNLHFDKPTFRFFEPSMRTPDMPRQAGF